ncbi:MAG TPA: exonuclease domain-containing protein [Geminicoccaceae bacterium]
MAPRLVHSGSALLILVIAGGGLVLAGWLIEAGAAPVPLALALGFLLVSLGCLGVWVLQELAWLRPLRTLTREIQLQIHAGPNRRLAASGRHALGDLPAALAALAERTRELRHEQDRALREAGARGDEQRVRLEAVLQSLGDGVIGCSADRRILLFNDAARRILGAPPGLGLDRPLDRLIASGPVRHVQRLLGAGDDHGEASAVSEAFLCTTADGERLLRCRMAPIRRGGGAAGFILEFVDATAHLRAPAGGPGEVARRVRALRAPAASLIAAAEMLGDPDLAPAHRHDFGGVVEREAVLFRARLDDLDHALGALAEAAWPDADLLTSDLGLQAGHRLADAEPPLVLQAIGLPVWLRGDGVHLAMLLEGLVRALAGASGVTRVDLEAARAGSRVRLDLRYAGSPVSPAVLAGWLDRDLPESAGLQRLRDVLERHQAEAWSQDGGRPEESVLRLLLPASSRLATGDAPADLPPRPEFYDFDLMERATATPGLLERPLASLTYVVFDTETTGLDPAGRDEIVQIAAVRIVNRRLLSGETFDRLVDPGRPIPQASSRFHGITDPMVRGRPPIEIALAQFHAFAEGAVLVAHNAAFDLAFLRKAEERAGVRFDQPVLDTLLLSAILHDHTDEHGLDAIAARFGVVLADRHQALGDALGTAEVFLRMIDLLAGRGVRTLGDALRLSERAVALRRRQAEAFGSGARRGVRVGG